MTTAEKMLKKAYSEDEYFRVDSECKEAGGKEIYNSNNPAGDAGIVSWSPTVVYVFPDGSGILVAYQDANVLSEHHIESYRKDHAADILE